MATNAYRCDGYDFVNSTADELDETYILPLNAVIDTLP